MLESLDSAWSAAWIAFLSRYRGASLMQSPLSVTPCTPQSICSDPAAVQRKSGTTSRFRRRASSFRERALFLRRGRPTAGYTSRVPNLLNVPPCRLNLVWCSTSPRETRGGVPCCFCFLACPTPRPRELRVDTRCRSGDLRKFRGYADTRGGSSAGFGVQERVLNSTCGAMPRENGVQNGPLR
jgi:hypothetical protein